MGGQQAEGQGQGEACEGRREEKEAEKATERRGKKDNERGKKKTLSENFQQLPTFGYLTTNLPVQHINTLTHTSYTG